MGRPLDEDIIIKILERWQKAFKENSHYVSASDLSLVIKDVRELPTIQPVATDTNVGDTISKFIDGLEEIFADLRERHVDDSVCGLCEYDGAYIGQSGDWCNECPGFEKDDCFKLSDKTRKEWTEEIITICKHVGNNSEIPNNSDCISRQQAIDALDDQITQCDKALGSFDISMKDEYAVKVERASLKAYRETLNVLPPAQPEPKEGHWIEGGIYRDVIECYCSECGQLMTTAATVRMNYCPNCGAKMGGKPNE